MTIASGTATTAELRTLWENVLKLEVMLRPYAQGDALGGAAGGKPGRFTVAEVDAQITATSAAITAVNS
jgi:hypothetical protein